MCADRGQGVRISLKNGDLILGRDSAHRQTPSNYPTENGYANGFPLAACQLMRRTSVPARPTERDAYAGWTGSVSRPSRFPSATRKASVPLHFRQGRGGRGGKVSAVFFFLTTVAAAGVGFYLWMQWTAANTQIVGLENSLAVTKERVATLDTRVREALAVNEHEGVLASEKAQKETREKAERNDISARFEQAVSAKRFIVEQAVSGAVSVILLDSEMFDRNSLAEEGKAILRELAQVIRRYPERKILIRGFPDTTKGGKAELDWEASSTRAALIARYFHEELNFDPRSLDAVGASRYTGRDGAAFSLTLESTTKQ